MNPNLDHLDPANWWPDYDALTDRRGVPAAAAIAAGLNDDVYWAEGSEPSTLVSLGGIEMCEGLPYVALYDRDPETGIGSDEPFRAVDPDQTVYIPQSAVTDSSKAAIVAGLKATFDALWALHEAGRIRRTDFDLRVERLRQVRAHFTITEDDRYG